VPPPNDCFSELEKAILDDEPAPPAQPKHRKPGRPPGSRAARLPHLPGPFIRIPIAWLKPTPRSSPFTKPPLWRSVYQGC